MKKKLIIAFSSCPNDTFMFDALINDRLENMDLEFEPQIADIEELNLMAGKGIPDISKISYAAFPEISDEYRFLSAGSALGYKNGPLVVSKKKIYPDEMEDVNMAVPGFKTTANFLLTILFPGVKDKKEYLFSDIEEAVLSNEVDAGLIIHESRFTFEKKGLKQVADLGERWEKEHNSPVPLGGIVIRRSLYQGVKKTVDNLLRQSVEFALRNPEASREFVKSHARELSDGVIQKHIDLYVNEYSVNIGRKGQEAIQLLFSKGEERGLFNLKNKALFDDPVN